MPQCYSAVRVWGRQVKLVARLGHAHASVDMHTRQWLLDQPQQQQQQQQQLTAAAAATPRARPILLSSCLRAMRATRTLAPTAAHAQAPENCRSTTRHSCLPLDTAHKNANAGTNTASCLLQVGCALLHGRERVRQLQPPALAVLQAGGARKRAAR
jgi:hypothetical protein